MQDVDRKPNRYHRPPPRVLSTEELVGFFGAIHTNYEGWRLRAMCAAMYRAGLRLSDVRGLRRIDVDLPARTIRVGKYAKYGKSRNLPIPEDLAKILGEYDRRAGMKRTLFFATSSGKQVSPTALRTSIRRVAARAGLDPKAFHPHAFRHTYATDLLKGSKGDIVAVQQALGHANPTTTLHYLHTDMERMRKAAEATEEFAAPMV